MLHGGHLDGAKSRRIQHPHPHWFGVVDGPVTVIAILGPQGERLHLLR
jgi:hypothetical protein